MTEPAWLAGLDAEVQRATVRLSATAASVHDAEVRAIAQLDRVLAALGETQERHERRVHSDVEERVKQAFRTGRFADLTPREQRRAARAIREVPAAAYAAFLQAHPSRGAIFVTEYFRHFEQIAGSTEADGYMRLLAHAASDHPVLRQGIPVLELVSVRGPMLIAGALNASSVSEAQRALRARGFDPGWSYTAWALAIWAWRRVEAGASFGELWSAVRSDLVVETLLLPRLRGESARKSWFGTGLRGRRAESDYAPALFVTALLRAYLRGADPADATQFTERLFASEFGDPRVPPEPAGWRRVRDIHSATYDGFLAQLISEDLDVFFAHAMRDPRRRAFWAGYLRSIKRTVCILDRATHERLTAKLRANEQLAGAISRARRFRTRGGESSAQAFCLYFDSIVVVEFSDTGNAAQVYDRGVFERHFERAIQHGELAGHGDLKRPKLARERILHMSSWEEDATELLAGSRIFPDRGSGQAHR